MAITLKKLFPILEHKQFLYLWISQLFSQITNGFLYFGLIFYIYGSTHLGVAVGGLFVINGLPPLLFGAWGGIIADIIDRRRLLIVINFLQAATLIAFIFTHQNLALLYTIYFFYEFLNQFFIPAEAASIPMLVGEKMLITANSMFNVTSYATWLIGFLLAGAAINFAGGISIIFIIGFFALIAAGVATLFLPRLKGEALERNSHQSWLSVIRDQFKTTSKIITQNKSVAMAFYYWVIMQFILNSLIAIITPYGETILGVNLEYLGLLFVIPVTIGAMLGMWILGRVQQFVSLQNVISEGFQKSALFLFAALVVPVVFTLLFHATFIAYLLSIVLLIVLMLFMSYYLTQVIVASQTAIQSQTATEHRGKIFGYLNVLLFGGSAIPVIVIGGILDTFGIYITAVFLGVLMLVFNYYLKRKFRIGRTPAPAGI